jgi:arabinogalactan endo-1,4-beta-galactosidase
MIMEIAYPWTTENNDNYNNIFGTQAQLAGFPFTIEGQSEFLIDFTQKMIKSGVSGIVYWEPAWISSDLKDLWGAGSSWENSTLFDFEGNALPSFKYMTYRYSFD